MRHPNCVVVVAACQDRSDPIYVMEWMSGGSLYEALGKEPPAPAHVRLMNAREIASVVDYLHQRHITHGDLKSLNAMLTSDLIAKICDFGAAIQRLNSVISVKSSAAAQGTIQWSAPELFHGVTANYCTDVYALGVIFWELAFCEVPFQNKNPSILMSLIKDGLTLEIPNPLPPCASGFLRRDAAVLGQGPLAAPFCTSFTPFFCIDRPLRPSQCPAHALPPQPPLPLLPP